MSWAVPAPMLFAAAVPVVYVAMVAIERCGTGWRWPEVRGWQLIGAQCFVVLACVNLCVSAVLARVLPTPPWSIAWMGPVAGTFLGYLVLSLGNSLLHRAYHRFAFLWRHVHRLHHVPQRLDVAGVMYQTPWEMLANAVLFQCVARGLLGLDPTATAACAFLGAFYGMFQHFNVRTPRWVGWVIQRPEAHCEHHRRGVHAGNYSDLPLWDMLAGSFHNPAHFEGELGFGSTDGRDA